MSDHGLTVQQIVARCGGAQAIAARSTIGKWAVYKWPKIGIPDEHWDLIMEMAGVTVDDIYRANRTAKHREQVAA